MKKVRRPWRRRLAIKCENTPQAKGVSGYIEVVQALLDCQRAASLATGGNMLDGRGKSPVDSLGEAISQLMGDSFSAYGSRTTASR